MVWSAPGRLATSTENRCRRWLKLTCAPDSPCVTLTTAWVLGPRNGLSRLKWNGPSSAAATVNASTLSKPSPACRWYVPSEQ